MSIAPLTPNPVSCSILSAPIRQYSGLSSMPIPLRPARAAASSEVAAPQNGSRTVQGIALRSQPQLGNQRAGSSSLRTQGSPQPEQQPPSAVPARMQRSANPNGIGAQWAPRKGVAAICHTFLAFLPFDGLTI